MTISGRKEVDLPRGSVPLTAAPEMYRQSNDGPGQTQTVDRRVRYHFILFSLYASQLSFLAAL